MLEALEQYSSMDSWEPRRRGKTPPSNSWSHFFYYQARTWLAFWAASAHWQVVVCFSLTHQHPQVLLFRTVNPFSAWDCPNPHAVLAFDLVEFHRHASTKQVSMCASAQPCQELVSSQRLDWPAVAQSAGGGWRPCLCAEEMKQQTMYGVWSEMYLLEAIMAYHHYSVALPEQPQWLRNLRLLL